MAHHTTQSSHDRLVDRLASRAILVDIEQPNKTLSVLPPPMAGFFEFSRMRVRRDVGQKVLSELFYQYLNVEEDFIKNLFTPGDTQLGRVFVHEPVLSSAAAIHVLDYGRATQHLIFDNRVRFSHRALAAVLGVILKLPPVKQVLASQQVKSRYLEALISHLEAAHMI